MRVKVVSLKYRRRSVTEQHQALGARLLLCDWLRRTMMRPGVHRYTPMYDLRSVRSDETALSMLLCQRKYPSGDYSGRWVCETEIVILD